jgi:precorrin-2 dehydrogenase / sirohydrochlorin ferrochelatase
MTDPGIGTVSPVLAASRHFRENWGFGGLQWFELNGNVMSSSVRGVASPLYPIGVVLEGRPCLVVGGGPVATSKARGLIDAGAIVTIISPQITDELATFAIARWHQRAYERGDLRGYRLVVAATSSADVNREVFSDGESFNVLVNAADQPDACAFTLPAVTRKGPITMTVATQGQSPAVAQWLRDRAAALLDDSTMEICALMRNARDRVLDAGLVSEGRPWRALIDSLVDAPQRDSWDALINDWLMTTGGPTSLGE